MSDGSLFPGWVHDGADAGPQWLSGLSLVVGVVALEFVTDLGTVTTIVLGLLLGVGLNIARMWLYAKFVVDR